MKAFKLDEPTVAELSKLIDAACAFAKAKEIPFVASAIIGIDKNITSEDVRVKSHQATAVYMNGDARVPPFFMIGAQFLLNGVEGGLTALKHHDLMTEHYGALLTEDNVEAACRVFDETGSNEAARRAGGSLPPIGTIEA